MISFINPYDLLTGMKPQAIATQNMDKDAAGRGHWTHHGVTTGSPGSLDSSAGASGEMRWSCDPRRGEMRPWTASTVLPTQRQVVDYFTIIYS